ncbi:MAG: single-stranded DNA-binding protein [Ignavibacteria bacterium]|nr:MAG: single-stranded DNA-binding protein [Ignavibacteria bacterium]
MAFSLNKIQLIGNLGQDCENRVTANDTSVTNFSIATTESYKTRDGEWKNETTWHNVVAFNLSDYMKDQLKKGRKFYVEGRLKKRSYENKEGKTIYVTEVFAEKLIPLDSSGQGGGNFASEPTNNYSAPEPLDSSEENNDLPF